MNPTISRLILAHLRPQPAIPAAFVLLLTSVLARMAMGASEPGLLMTWGVPLGLLASAGLALAAGFCSFFPPLIWLVLAWWGPLAAPNPKIAALPVTLWIATAVAVAGLGIQAFRVATGRFKPTIEPDQDTA
jgi:hypothetical protein